jgi:uncharacterized membrane protein
MRNKLLPALIGGGSIFLLSLLLSLIPGVWLLTCFFILLGGTLATYLYIRRSPTPVSGGEGIIVGALAGAVTGLLRLAYLPINYRLNSENIDRMIQRAEEQLRQVGVSFHVNLPLFLLAVGIIAAVLLVILEAIGGAVGVALFEKRKGDANPPAPDNETADGHR